MNRSATVRPTEDQAAGAVFVSGIFFNDLSVQNRFGYFVVVDFPFDAALGGMLAPVVLSFSN